MSDDIVTRLYNLCICCRCGCEQQCSDCEAADEIERLRAEVKALKYMISPAPTPDYKYFVHPDAASTFAKLLRGEFND